MARAFLFVLDSVGIGGAADAAAYGDEGADTIGHIAEGCAEGLGDRAGLRSGPLRLPNMASLGLARAAALATGRAPPGLAEPAEITGFHGAAEETSKGKDTPSGHWEIAGAPVAFDWTYLPQTVPALPEALTAALMKEARLGGVLANCHAAGTEVIERFGEEHIRTGWPIVYTSVDSVIQIAAHEEHFGRERLYDVCLAARRLVDGMGLNIGRVIARPFVGETAETFRRTPYRRDYAIPPPEATLADRLVAHGSRVIGLGKIGDIFAQRGISEVRKGASNMALFDTALRAIEEAGAGDLVFANFVDFDTEFGHRRDIPGYAAALEDFDHRLPEALGRLRSGDMLILTADHGNDPSFRGTDHTRERVPILGFGPGLKPVSVGLRPSFADIGETVAEHLGLPAGPHGKSFRDLL